MPSFNELHTRCVDMSMFQGEITGKRKPTDWNANYVGLASVSLLCNAEANQWELVLAFLISL